MSVFTCLLCPTINYDQYGDIIDSSRKASMKSSNVSPSQESKEGNNFAVDGSTQNINVSLKNNNVGGLIF